jgi:hypothetical protein
VERDYFQVANKPNVNFLTCGSTSPGNYGYILVASFGININYDL